MSYDHSSARCKANGNEIKMYSYMNDGMWLMTHIYNKQELTDQLNKIKAKNKCI